MKKHLEDKFIPLSSKPDSVKQDLENLQREVNPQRPPLDGRTYAPSGSAPLPPAADSPPSPPSLQLKCCGLKGPADWNPVPESCRCQATEKGCSASGFYSAVRTPPGLRPRVPRVSDLCDVSCRTASTGAWNG